MKDYISLLIFYAIIFSSCATQNKFERIADKHPEWLAEKCSDEYLPQEKYIKGKDSIVTVTETRTDSVIVTQVVNGKTTYVKVPCPVCNQNTRTVFRTDTLRLVDSAKVYLARKEAHETKLTLIVAEHDRDKYRRQRNNLIGLCIAIFGIGALLIFRPKLF